MGALAHDRLRQGKAEGRLMSRKIKRPFAALPIELLRSPAFRSLSLTALRILFRIELEYAQNGGRNNGYLVVTFDQFVEYGARRKSIPPSLNELTTRGIIDIPEKGRAGNGPWRRPNKYRLTYRDASGKPPTDEWKTARVMVETSTQNNFRPDGETPPAPGGETPLGTSGRNAPIAPQNSRGRNAPTSKNLSIYLAPSGAAAKTSRRPVRAQAAVVREPAPAGCR
jgi:hypothetical protein